MVRYCQSIHNLPYSIVTAVVLSLSFCLLLSGIVCAQGHDRNEIIRIRYDKDKSPYDKQKAVGYSRIGVVWGQLFKPLQKNKRAISNLKDAMNKYTGIATVEQKYIELGSEKLFSLPIIFILSDDLVELTPTELGNLQKYIKMGGFIFIDGTAGRDNPDTSSGGPFRNLLREVIPNARFSPIPNSDPIYHSFFDFPDGAPGSQLSTYSPYLEGVYHKGRLVAVSSNKGYAGQWHDNADSYLKMGVNLIVFAMTQEGSIAETY